MPSLPYHHGSILKAGKNGHVVTDLREFRRTDKNSPQRNLSKGWNGNIRLKAVDLPSIGVSLNGGIENAESRLITVDDCFREQDRPGTRPHDGESLCNGLFNGFQEAESLHEQPYGRTFSTGNHQSVYNADLIGTPHREDVAAKPGEDGEMFFKISLKREYSNRM